MGAVHLSDLREVGSAVSYYQVGCVCFKVRKLPALLALTAITNLKAQEIAQDDVTDKSLYIILGATFFFGGSVALAVKYAISVLYNIEHSWRTRFAPMMGVGFDADKDVSATTVTEEQVMTKVRDFVA